MDISIRIKTLIFLTLSLTGVFQMMRRRRMNHSPCPCMKQNPSDLTMTFLACRHCPKTLYRTARREVANSTVVAMTYHSISPTGYRQKFAGGGAETYRKKTAYSSFSLFLLPVIGHSMHCYPLI